MIDCTNTTESTFQVLDPIIVVPPGSNPLAYVESGFTMLTQGQQLQVITFSVPKASSYVIIEAEIVNTTDPTPINFDWQLIAQSLLGFTIQLSGLPDTGNYYFQWRVGIPPV